MVYGIYDDTVKTTQKLAEDTAETIKILNDQVVEPLYEGAEVVIADTYTETEKWLNDL